MENLNVQVCFSPAMYNYYEDKASNVVVIDTLRATSSICNAFEAGAAAIIPVADAEEAREYKKKGFLVAAERDGIVLDFADFGNSPFNFSKENVEGRIVVYSTTNGTRTITMAKGSRNVLIGSFLNITSLAEFLAEDGADVLMLCAGWKNKFNIEDSLFAGALADKLIEKHGFKTNCDSAKVAMDMWNIAQPDLLGYIEKAAQRGRLRDKGLDDCIEFCHSADSTTLIPVFREGKLVKLRQTE